MGHWWELLVVVISGVVLLWLGMVALLFLSGRGEARSGRLKEVLRLVPNVLRLVRRLIADPEVPRGVRVRLVLLVAYLSFPIDLVPDFIPVVGYADDVILVAVVLRSVVRHGGPEALERHWPGTPDGLRVVQRLAGV